MTLSLLITGKLHDSAIATFAKDPALKLTYKPDCSLDELYALAPTAHALITRSETNIDTSLLKICKELKVVVRAAVGVGNIDLDYATQKGILVINTPGKNTNSAAELTMGLILSMLRKLPEAQATLKAGGWDRHRFSGHELRGRTIGIVGLGNVGHRVAQFCQGFDMKVIAYDPYVSPEKFKRFGVHHCHSLEELARASDILSVHVPLNPETRGMIDAGLIGLMKPGSFLVNAARGGIIDEQAIIASLSSGHIAGAGIDTFDDEPTPLPSLVTHPKVYCSPHIGASTEEAQIAIADTVVDQLYKFLEGGVVDHPVNLPELKVIDHPILKAYAVLIEKLGILMSQLLSFNPKEATIHYRGDIADLDHSILRLSWMKGYASQRVDDFVSYVNAQQHIESMGLVVRESTDKSFDGYKSAVKISLDGESESLTVGGIVFDEKYMRISLVNGFYFEIEPSGHMLLLENTDKPGVIGHIGMELARQGINISAFTLSRNSKGGTAMAIVCVDSELSAQNLAALGQIENILSVHAIKL